MSIDRPHTLPAWLQAQAQSRGNQIALRHKHLGIWHVRTWAQVRAEVATLAVALKNAGFSVDDKLVVLSRPRREALLAALAAQWAGGKAVLLDPLTDTATLNSLLWATGTDFVFAEGQAEVAQVQSVQPAPLLLFYADGRGLTDKLLPSYASLTAHEPALLPLASATAQQSAFSFYRVAGNGDLQVQHIAHAELLREGAQLVAHEELSADDEALAARAFAASSQARYLVAPWLLAGFRLNFPESLATRDQDRRELAPTLILGTRQTYERLYLHVLERLPLPGSMLRALADWALKPESNWLHRVFGNMLIRRPLRDVLGLGRTRVALIAGDELEPAVRDFLQALGVPVRSWPEKAHWRPAPADEDSPDAYPFTQFEPA